MYPHGGMSGGSLASGPLSKSTAIGLLILAVALAAPTGAAAQATLAVAEVAPCYREQETVHLVGDCSMYRMTVPSVALVFFGDTTGMATASTARTASWYAWLWFGLRPYTLCHASRRC